MSARTLAAVLLCAMTPALLYLLAVPVGAAHTPVAVAVLMLGCVVAGLVYDGGQP
jgi:1,4-dihydroxy-2-naphthoate octaprenyltransferase